MHQHMFYTTLSSFGLSQCVVYHAVNADNNQQNLCLLYLSDSYRATVELRDALVGLVTSLPHPIILKGGKGS